MKNKRQQAIAELITQQHITRQEDLAALLNERGFHVTQSTVSRDIRQMNLQKEAAGGQKACYVMPKAGNELSQTYVRVIKESVISVDTAMNLLVLKTQPGMAMAVAACVDSFQYHEIVGTIAGDDTVMVAIRSVQDALVVQKKIRLLLSEA